MFEPIFNKLWRQLCFQPKLSISEIAKLIKKNPRASRKDDVPPCSALKYP